MLRRWLVTCLLACAATPLAAAVVLAQPVPGGPIRGLPVQAPYVPDPATRPLPTDSLMSPPPVVPPRTAYQGPPPRNPAAPPVPQDPLDLSLPGRMTIPLPQNPGRFFRIVPRYGRLNNQKSDTHASDPSLPEGTQRVVITGGVIVYVSPGENQPEIEFATDSAVVWVRGPAVENVSTGFEASPDNKREIEVYLAGHVVIRTSSARGGQQYTQTLRADEVYYDVARNRAIAIDGDLEMSSPKMPDSIHMRGKEIRRLDLENWEALHARVYASKLPSDPGLEFDSNRITLRERRVELRNVFGIPYRDFEGNRVEGFERLLTVRNGVTWVNGAVPVFYWPYLRTDLAEPLGPLVGLGGGMDRIFGTQVYTTWDMYKVIGVRPPQGHRWRLNLDFLSDRGPAAGTDYGYMLPVNDEIGYSPGQGYVRLYGINDGGVDVLGGDRGPEPTHEATRGRASWWHKQEVMEGMYFQGQVSYLSDKNFLEQFFRNEFMYAPNQETFAYLTYQRQNLWSSGLVMPKLGRDWESQTEWLPRFDGAVTGQSFWDLFVYNARANAAYAQNRPSEINPFPVMPTDRRIDTGRLDLLQDLSLPLDAGPFKVVPYGVLDLAYYTQDLTGNDQGRVYGGGGVRGSLPLSRLYESVSSELFNVRGLYHKVTLAANYYYAQSNTPYTQLPLLDRLDDDVTYRTYNNIRPHQPQLVSGPAGVALATSPLFDQQQYTIRRLVDNRVDTLDDVNVVQAEIRQRFQTKRGYPGLEHTVDLINFDVSASFFPHANRDNYGKSWAFLEYNGLWNVGDRTSVLSSGWFDPFDFGAKYWNLGLSVDRPDRTSFYIGYRQTDPLNSKAVTGSLSYQMSRRYYAGVGFSYDFGISQALTNSFNLTRTGSDVTITVGVTYNALVNNFGVTFLILPNFVQTLAPNRVSAVGGSQLTGR